MFDCMNFSKHCIKREGQVSWVQKGEVGGWGTKGRGRWVRYEREE
jgi:hypothetical protein